MYFSIAVLIVVVLGLVYLFFHALNRKGAPLLSRVEIPMPPVKPIQMVELWAPTCFAQGVAKSLVEERDMWVEEEFDNEVQYGYRIEKLRIRHSVTHVLLVMGVRSYMTTGNQPLPGGFDYLEVSPQPIGTMGHTDQYHIAEAIVANPIGQYKKQLEIYRKDEEKKTKATKHFEQLGCPSNTVTTNTTTTT